MHEMLPDIENVFPSAYTCSECGWNFPLSRMSDLGDFFQQKNAMRSFSEHDCTSKPRAVNGPKQTSRNSHSEEDSPRTGNSP